ncbi:hypothetical protein BKG82_26335 [Mycobacteroides chelonae]|uniref:Uncharacterized protein n=1 Tax=Mycobacteroides chelonae TaxID=1774 RepID=A0A1S1LCN9_MYCCH|nr:hypothetical protein [Mycobacteroides chelonae]OHU47178.1 hypothetical protein BKG82_26335 [Mycobacteroides chelonae]
MVVLSAIGAQALGQALEVAEIGSWVQLEHACANAHIDVEKVAEILFDTLKIELQFGVGYLEAGHLVTEEPWFAEQPDAVREIDELNASARKSGLAMRYQLAYRLASVPQRLSQEVRR